MSEALHEVVSVNPHATEGEISSAVIRYLQSSVASAIRNVNLPTPPSPAKAALEKYRALRYRTPRRRSVGARNELIEELYGLKLSLNGHGYMTNTGEHLKKWNGGSYSDRLTPGLEARLWSARSTTSTPAQLGLETENMIFRKRQRFSPYHSLTEVEDKTFRLFYHDSFISRLSNPIYQTISKALEERLRDFSERTGLEWEFGLAEESDIELQGWKRFVLRISVSAGDFEQRLKLWDELDVTIRQLLAELSKEHTNESEKIND